MPRAVAADREVRGPGLPRLTLPETLHLLAFAFRDCSTSPNTSPCLKCASDRAGQTLLVLGFSPVPTS